MKNQLMDYKIDDFFKIAEINEFKASDFTSIQEGYENLSSSDKLKRLEIAKEFITSAADFGEIDSSVNLYLENATDTARYRESLPALSSYQQSRIRRLIASNIECTKQLNCSSNGVAVAHTCTIFKGLSCSRGWDLNRIMLENLSPAEVAIVQDAVETLKKVKN